MIETLVSGASVSGPACKYHDTEMFWETQESKKLDPLD